MPSDPNREYNRRARAAWAYAGITYEELAERTGIKVPTLRGYLRRAKPNTPNLSALLLIGTACEVPAVFMQEGFAAETTDPGEISTARRIHALEERMRRYDAVLHIDTEDGLHIVRTIEGVMDEVEASVKRRAVGGPPGPPGAFGRDAEDSRPTEPSQPRRQPPSAGASSEDIAQ